MTCKSTSIVPEACLFVFSLVFLQLANGSTAEWASGGDPTQQLVWSHGSVDGVLYHQFNLTTQQEFTEIDQQAAWGTWYFSTADADDVRLIWQLLTSQGHC